MKNGFGVCNLTIGHFTSLPYFLLFCSYHHIFVRRQSLLQIPKLKYYSIDKRAREDHFYLHLSLELITTAVSISVSNLFVDVQCQMDNPF